MSVLENENLTGVNTEGKHANKPVKYLTAASIKGDKIYDSSHEHMGAIEDIMLDVNSGKIEYVVIKFGGFLTINEKYFAIPWKLLKLDPQKKVFIIDMSREKLENAPGFDMGHWPETNFHAEATYWDFV